VTPAFTLTLDRHGGFAGIAMRATIDSTELSPDEARDVWAMVAPAELAAADRASSTGGGRRPDSFTYRLTVTTAQGRTEYAFDEQQVGAPVRPLLQRLERDLAI